MSVTSRFIVGIMASLASMASISDEPSTSPQNNQIESSAISGQFDLTNHRGEKVSEDSYAGLYRLVFFGFTQCPDICPTTMSRLAQVVKGLGEDQSKIKPLFISVDHENDTQEIVSQYVRYFHPSIDGLLGTKEEIETVAKNFNTSYGKNSISSSTGYYHSSYIYLMDQGGALLDLYSHATDPQIVLSQLRDLL